MSESYTQAGNFYSSVGGNVDMRRGIFTASVSLGRIVGNALMGPYLPLDLTYEPTNPIDIGFGVGWSFKWTVYDRNSRTLYLSAGDTYKITDTGSKVTIRQKPLITTYFEQLGDEAYRVVHKSGEVTILTGKKYGASLKVPTAHYTPVGHKLNFAWDNNGGRPRIKTISDANGVLVDVTYNNMQLTTTVVLWPGSPSERTLLFTRSGGSTHVLVKLTIADQDWSFKYCQLNVSGQRVSYLNKITGPDGLIEEATYTANGFVTPACSNLGVQPNVTRHVQAPNANQPPIVTEYKYSTTNHFGGGSTGITQWSIYDDNLFLSSKRTYTY